MQNHILSQPERDFVEIENEITAGVYSTSVQVVKWIKETFEIEYSERGVQRILRKLGFVYKKTTAVPCKADFVEQKRKKVIHFTFYPNFKELREVIHRFFDSIKPYKAELRTLMRPNFQRFSGAPITCPAVKSTLRWL